MMPFNEILKHDFKNKKSYLSNNSFFYDYFNNSNNVINIFEKEYFKKIPNFCYNFNIIKINETYIDNIKTIVDNDFSTIEQLEIANEAQLINFIKKYVNSFLNVDGIQVDLKLSRLSELQVDNDTEYDDWFASYDEILKNQQLLDKNELVYSLFAGASVFFTTQIYSKSNFALELYNINEELFYLYKQMLDFMDLYVWITDNFEQNAYANSVQIKNSENYININAPTFVSLLQHYIIELLAAKHDLSFNNIDKFNIWNYRVGCILWNNLINVVGYEKYLFFIEKLLNLNCKDFNYVLREMFYNTKHFKNIVKSVCK